MTDTITMPREVAKRILRNIEIGNKLSAGIEMRREIEAALEQPQGEQEPVAWMWSSNDGTPSSVTFGGPNSNTPKDWIVQPLYTRPQPRQPLTDGQIEQCMKQAYSTVQGRNLEHAFARAIERAHGIGGEA